MMTWLFKLLRKSHCYPCPVCLMDWNNKHVLMPWGAVILDGDGSELAVDFIAAIFGVGFVREDVMRREADGHIARGAHMVFTGEKRWRFGSVQFIPEV